MPLTRDPASDRLRLTARLAPGAYDLTILEPPRSVVIAWDTSGSVASYIPRTLAAVRVWSGSLQPDRDALQLLPFGTDELLMDNWGERPEDVFPYLAALPQASSSDAEGALAVASDALLMRDGARGVVLITDGETSQLRRLWQPLLAAKHRVVALAIDTSDPDSVRILKDWTAVNTGYFHRVTGQVGLADGLDLAAALFRAPKGYRMRASLEPQKEPEGQGALRISAAATAPDAPPPAPGGGLQVILDASGSMLQRMPDGQRRIAVAHDALAGLVRDTIPPGTPFAFRAFGLEKDACRSELLLPFAPLDPARAAAALRGTPAINLANTAIAAVCEAWLGPYYQMTAQANLVHPGVAAQQAHRDYHLGFQTADVSASYPALVHDVSPILTLQGAVAHAQAGSVVVKVLAHSSYRALFVLELGLLTLCQRADDAVLVADAEFLRLWHFAHRSAFRGRLRLGAVVPFEGVVERFDEGFLAADGLDVLGALEFLAGGDAFFLDRREAAGEHGRGDRVGGEAHVQGAGAGPLARALLAGRVEDDVDALLLVVAAVDPAAE